MSKDSKECPITSVSWRKTKRAATVSDDQTFSFYPEPCPNSIARQQTRSGHVPDCRAYELVTPEEAGSINLFASGAQSPKATDPPRIMVAGNFGTLEGVNAPNFLFDPYVATRTLTGWEMHYAGIPAEIAGGPGGQPGIHAGVLNAAPVADDGLNQVVHWRFGPPSLFGEYFYIGPRYYSPYVYGPRVNPWAAIPPIWPTSLARTIQSTSQASSNSLESPENGWSGDQELSNGGTHYFFSTNQYQFAPGGLLERNCRSRLGIRQ